MLADWKIVITRDDVTLTIAILGAGLGIMNLFIDLWRNRVSLKVIPKPYTSAVGGGRYNWNIVESGMGEVGGLAGESGVFVESYERGKKMRTGRGGGVMGKV